VRIAPFALGRLEITPGQWRAATDTQPSHFRRCGEDGPVENVSWEDAPAFVARLYKRVSGKAA
jgi:formylglycine-generating enzyme required for sulfatase activity